MKTLPNTPRLLIRQFDLNDAAFVLALVNTPGWLAFIGDRNIKNRHDAEIYLLNGPLKNYTELGFGLYGIQLKNSGALIGMCGILKRGSLAHADLGFALLPNFEGQGLAFEAASAILRYAKNELKLSPVLAITLPKNKRSVNLLLRLGFVFEKTIQDKEDELLLYSKD